MIEFRSTAYLALGANLPSHAGSPEKTLALAIQTLSESGVQVVAQSRFFATPCFPKGAGPDYVNAVIKVTTDLSAKQLLGLCHRIEGQFHRKREIRWGTRTIDLDILSHDDRVLPDLPTFKAWLELPRDEQVRRTPAQLILPHPRLQDRAFVLVPLCDIAPDWVHPVLHRTANELRALLSAEELSSIRELGS